MQQVREMPAHQIRLAVRPPGASPLKDSPSARREVQELGIHEPFIVRSLPDPDQYEVLTQPARFIAAVRLGMQSIPVLVRDDIDDEEALRVVSSQYGVAEKNPIDDALWLKEQLEQQQEGEGGGSPNIARLARLTDRGRSEVTRTLQLLELPLEVQDLIRSGELPPSHARPLLKLKKPQQQCDFARRSVLQSLSLKALQKIIDSRSKPAAVPAPIANLPSAEDKSPDIVRLERTMTDILGSSVEIDPGQGQMTIKYFGDLDALQGILERLGYTEE